MERLTSLWLRLKALARRGQLERDLEDEMAFHLAMREAKLGGSAPAHRVFGNSTLVKEQCRDQWVFAWLEALMQDIRYALRQVRRDAGFAAVAILTLAFGIGATTSIYTMFSAVLWRSLALPETDRMVSILQAAPLNPHFAAALSPGDLEEIRESAGSLASMTGWQNIQTSVVDSGGEPVIVETSRVLTNFFDVTRVQPAMGRGFLPGEDEPGHDRVAVMSNDLWRNHFSADPHIVGRTIRIDRRDCTVIGVMPPKFRFPRGWRDLWMPLAMTPDQRHSRSVTLIETAGRLKPGHTLGNLTSEVNTIALRMEREHPLTNKSRRYATWTLNRAMVGDYLPVYFAMLFGAALFVLLICCANVANLQFARATSRWREVAVRSAIGASHRRIVRQLLTESLVLALIAAVFGIITARWSLAAIKYSVPVEIRRYMAGWADIRLNSTALTVALAATLLSGILSGLAPAVRGSRGLSQIRFLPPGRHRTRSLLVAVQLALALILLTGAGLTVRGFHTLVGGQGERHPESLLTVRLVLSPEVYHEDRQIAGFYDAVLAKVRALPGVRAASAVNALPYSRRATSLPLAIENVPQPSGTPQTVHVEAASADYFATMNIALRAGRLLNDDPQPQAAISDYMARRWWTGQSAIGHRIRLGGGSTRWITVVGVVADIPYSALDRAPHSVVYVPYTQRPERDMNIAIRTAAAPLSVMQAVSGAIRSVDPEQPIDNIATLDDLVHQEAFGFRYLAWLMGILGTLALALSAVGVYGVISYLVSQQTHEIGIRLALGAERSGVLRMVFGQGMRTAITGVLLGVLPAFGISKVVAFMFFSEKAASPAALLIAPMILLAASALAILVPARRAMLTDPMAALREE